MLRLIMPFAVGLLAGLGGTSALAVTRAKDAAKHAVPAKAAADSTHADSTKSGEHAATASAPAADTTHAAATPADIHSDVELGLTMASTSRSQMSPFQSSMRATRTSLPRGTGSPRVNRRHGTPAAIGGTSR